MTSLRLRPERSVIDGWKLGLRLELVQYELRSCGPAESVRTARRLPVVALYTVRNAMAKKARAVEVGERHGTQKG